MLPSLNSATRSQMLCTRSSRCDDNSTLTPRSLRLRMICRSSAVACGSRPDVGSSRIAICASFIRISASPSRWRMPREKVSTGRSATSCKTDMIEGLRDLRFALVSTEPHQPRGVAHIVGGREIVIEADLVRQVTDPPFDRERLPYRIKAEHTCLPVRDVAQTEQHQDGRGLARSVGTEQPEDLALRDRERDPLDDSDPVIALGEALYLDDVVRTHRRPNLATAPTSTRSAAPMMPTPMIPHCVEVPTVTRKVADADSPRALARSVAT